MGAKKMPKEVRDEIIRYANMQMESSKQYDKVVDLIESYNVPIENLLACSNNPEQPQTEGLAFLNNCECDNLEEIIKEIEEVFNWFMDNK